MSDSDTQSRIIRDACDPRCKAFTDSAAAVAERVAAINPNREQVGLAVRRASQDVHTNVRGEAAVAEANDRLAELKTVLDETLV